MVAVTGPDSHFLFDGGLIWSPAPDPTETKTLTNSNTDTAHIVISLPRLGPCYCARPGCMAVPVEPLSAQWQAASW
jgi:hypothetical protein